MISSRAPGGREPRKHRKSEISKRVTIICGNLEIEGVLQNISVGGAAIECSTALDAGFSDEIDIEDIGTYPANFVRRRQRCRRGRVYHYGGFGGSNVGANHGGLCGELTYR